MKKSNLFFVVSLVLVLVVFSGCMPGDGTNNPNNIAGFFTGIWHGWLAPVSLFVSFFNKSNGIYEVHNNGFMYNLGYYMAIISGFFGLSLTRKRKKD